MEQTLSATLIALSEAFASRTRLNESTIGRLCAADGRFFSRIREGRTFTVKKFDEVVQWFSDNWPVDLDWPDGIARPASIKEAAE